MSSNGRAPSAWRTIAALAAGAALALAAGWAGGRWTRPPEPAPAPTPAAPVAAVPADSRVFYLPIDTAAYLKDQWGVDAGAWRRLRLKTIDPQDAARLGPVPADPLSLALVRIERHSPPVQSAMTQGELQGAFLVVDHPADRAKIFEEVERMRSYLDSVADAMPADLPPEAKAVVRAYRAGGDEDALIAQVRKDNVRTRLSVDQILYLHAIGVPQNAVKSLLEAYHPSGRATN